MKHFQHVDLFGDIANLCAADLKRSVSVLPIQAEDLGQKSFHYPIERFSTVSAGTSNKFTFSGDLNFADLIVSAIGTGGGKHYHFGELSNEQLQLTHARLTRAQIATERFFYMGNVPSLWNALLTIDAHVDIGSFPMRGGKGEIEAQGASFPLLIYKDPDDPRYLNVRVAIVSPEAGTIRRRFANACAPSWRIIKRALRNPGSFISTSTPKPDMSRNWPT